jgi:hypothetical protein
MNTESPTIITLLRPGGPTGSATGRGGSTLRSMNVVVVVGSRGSVEGVAGGAAVLVVVIGSGAVEVVVDARVAGGEVTSTVPDVTPPAEASVPQAPRTSTIATIARQGPKVRLLGARA